MHTGSFLGFGGVGVISKFFGRKFFESQGLVIFQQHRPGPSLPEGQSYLTIGWKQVKSIQTSDFLELTILLRSGQHLSSTNRCLIPLSIFSPFSCLLM